MLLIPKVNGDFRVVRIVEVLRKALSGVFNCQIGKEVQFHYVLHGFRAFRGTGTASLETNLLQEITSIR